MFKAIVSLCNSGTAESVRFNDVSARQQILLQVLNNKNPSKLLELRYGMKAAQLLCLMQLTKSHKSSNAKRSLKALLKGTAAKTTGVFHVTNFHSFSVSHTFCQQVRFTVTSCHQVQQPEHILYFCTGTYLDVVQLPSAGKGCCGQT